MRRCTGHCVGSKNEAYLSEPQGIHRLISPSVNMGFIRLAKGVRTRTATIVDVNFPGPAQNTRIRMQAHSDMPQY